MDLKAMMERAKATDVQGQRASQPTQPQQRNMRTETKDFFVGIAESLFSIWKAVQSGSGGSKLGNVEVEARLGMILSQQSPNPSRWKSQISSNLVTGVTESDRRMYDLKFEAGTDLVLVEYLRNALVSSNFSIHSKRVRCDTDKNRWDIGDRGEILGGENKRRFVCNDIALLSHQYDIRIAAAVETGDCKSTPGTFTQERLKRRMTFRRANGASKWQIDITEVETTELGAGLVPVGGKLKQVEVEFEMESSAALSWLSESKEPVAIEKTKAITAELIELIKLCIPGNSESPMESPLQVCPRDGAEAKELMALESTLRADAGLPTSSKFLGSMTINMSRRGFATVLSNRYFLAEKSDGVRNMLFVVRDTSQGAAGGPPVALLLNRAREVSKPHGAHAIGAALGLGTVLDGEILYSRSLRASVYMIFDVLMVDKGGRRDPCFKLPFSQRLEGMRDLLARYYRHPAVQAPAAGPGSAGPGSAGSGAASTSPMTRLVGKTFVEKSGIAKLLSKITSESGEKIFRDREHHHKTDGIIFQSDTPYVFFTDDMTMKWKWPDMRSVDLLVQLASSGGGSGGSASEGAAPRVSLFCGGPDGSTIDCTKRNAGLGLFDTYRLLADVEAAGGFSGGSSRSKKNHIAEMFYDPAVGSWSYSHLRADKQEPNYIDTVMGVLMEQAEAITVEELQYRLLAATAGGGGGAGGDDFAGQMKRLAAQLLAEQRDGAAGGKSGSNSFSSSSSSSSGSGSGGFSSTSNSFSSSGGSSGDITAADGSDRASWAGASSITSSSDGGSLDLSGNSKPHAAAAAAAAPAVGAPVGAAAVWVKAYSKSHQRDYWYRQDDPRNTRWDDPDAAAAVGEPSAAAEQQQADADADRPPTKQPRIN